MSFLSRAESCLAVAPLIALAALLPRAARADGPVSLSIAAAGTCPSAEQVQAELHQILPEAGLELSGDVVDSDVIVSDRGNGFSVKVRGQRRRFKDVKRDCTERARHVAVFTVLIVDPLHVPQTQEPEPEVEPEPLQKEVIFVPPPPPPKPAPEPSPFDLSLGPIAQVALKNEASSATQAGGLGLRLRYGRGIGVTLGLAGLLPSSLHYAAADARATWVPLDLGLSLAQRSENWEVSLDLGAAGALLLVEGQGQGLDETQQASRFEMGGRIGAQVRYWASRHAGVCGGMFATYFPKPYSLQVEGLGAVGQTPHAWVGGSLGALIRL